MDEGQVERNVEQGEGKLLGFLGEVNAKASDLKGKAEDAFGDVRDMLEEANDERAAVRRSEDEAARREADTPPGPDASASTP